MQAGVHFARIDHYGWDFAGLIEAIAVCYARPRKAVRRPRKFARTDGRKITSY
jgi:hypothetical protein